MLFTFGISYSHVLQRLHVCVHDSIHYLVNGGQVHIRIAFLGENPTSFIGFLGIEMNTTVCVCGVCVCVCVCKIFSPFETDFHYVAPAGFKRVLEIHLSLHWD